jgi:hypothetical protein
VVRSAIALVVVAGCAAGAGTPAKVSTLRPACAGDQRWDGTRCRSVGDDRAKVALVKQANAEFKREEAAAALAALAAHGPLDHDTNITLWEQRGIEAAYREDDAAATRAFDMLLALNPSHLLSYTLSPKATFVFERARVAAGEAGAPVLDVSWAHGQRVGAPVPIVVEVVADPKRFLRRATVFVRRRGEPGWKAADVTLGAPGALARVTLPAIDAPAATALEVYARAYDDRDNEVLTWADPKRPREIPLRFDPRTPWYRKWWVWAAVGGVVATTTGIAVYAATREPGAVLPPVTVSSPAR